MKEDVSILNLGSGKVVPLDLHDYRSYFLVNLDSGYYDGVQPSEVFSLFETWVTERPLMNIKSSRTLFVKEDAFNFLEKYQLVFDKIVIYRFLEHIPKKSILYFIYLLACSLKRGGVVDCIVPNYNVLAGRILKEDPFDKDFEAEDIITTYELLNEPESPHCSIWTPARIRKFFMLEKRFSVVEIDNRFVFDGRDIYLRALLERI